MISVTVIELLMTMLILLVRSYMFEGGSPFLRKVDDILTTELQHMPGHYSLTALLNTWVSVLYQLLMSCL